MKVYDSNITIRIPNNKDVKVNITTEIKSHIIHTSDIKTKSATELIRESVNEMDTLRIIKKYIDNGWMSRLDYISSLKESMNKDYFFISELLINSSLDVVLYKDKENHTFLLYAFQKNLGICKLLIQRGADVNAWDKFGNTPLHSAVFGNNIELAKLLIDSGADVNAQKGLLGNTPLHSAVWGDNIALAKLLISSGADVNAKDYKGDTLLEYAIQKNKEELAELLILAGANISFKNKDGYTPLHLCAMKDNLELFISLLERGADPELKSDCGDNCLHLAVLNNSQNIVYRILKYHNMDINAKNDKGYSPIKLAKDKLIYNLLIENGAYDEVKELLKRANYESKIKDILASVTIICFTIVTIGKQHEYISKQHEYTEIISCYFGFFGLISLILLVMFNCPYQSTKIFIFKRY